MKKKRENLGNVLMLRKPMPYFPKGERRKDGESYLECMIKCHGDALNNSTG